MALSDSRNAYEDCYAILDMAVASEKGIRYHESSQSLAKHLINRLNYARALNRRMNKEIFDETDPRHGVSTYDSLIVSRPKLDDGKWWVYIQLRAFNPSKIEYL
jgi:hypothetical protein